MAFVAPDALLTSLVPRVGALNPLGEVVRGYTPCTLERIAENPTLGLLPAGAYEIKPYSLGVTDIMTDIANTLGLKPPVKDPEACSYISPFDPFAIPLTAVPVFGFGTQIKITDFRIIGPIACIIEDPLPLLDFTKPAESLRSLEEPLRIGIWPFWAPNPGFGKLGPLFFEPFIFNSNPPPIAPRPYLSTGPAGCLSLGTGYDEGIFPPLPESPGLATATIAGYHTDRNFFDRQWILKEREYIRKYNSLGRFETPWKPNRASFPIDPDSIKDFVPSPITPYTFFSTNILTGACAEDVMMPYLRCADHIMHYKPTEIKALRFYYFAVTTTTTWTPLPATQIVPGTPCATPTPNPPEVTLLHMTVDANHDIMSILKLLCSREIVNGPCGDERKFDNLGKIPDPPRDDTLSAECFNEKDAYDTYIGELENFFTDSAAGIASGDIPLV